MAHLQFTPSETETDYLAVPLLSHQGELQAWTVVDLEDFLLVVTPHRWHLGPKNCACRMSERQEGKQRTIYLHREIMGLPRVFDGREVDHRNRVPLDNRRKNLRVTTHQVNAQNRTKQAGTSSRYRGVSWDKWNKKWCAYIYYDGKLHHLGYFEDEDAAAYVAQEARTQHHPGALD